MTGKQLAWEFYVQRIQRVVQEQAEQFANGHPATRMIMDVPSAESVALADKALADAAKAGRGEILSRAIKPLMQACDAIDNSHSKSETVERVRAAIEEQYQALRAMLEAEKQPSSDGRIAATGGEP